MSGKSLRARPEPAAGLNWIVRAGEDDNDTGMSFGLLRLAPGERFPGAGGAERAVLLLSGVVEIAWQDERATAARRSLFDERPVVLHLDAATGFSLLAKEESELAIVEVANDRRFPAHLFDGESLLEEERRGEGRVDEASFRFVRTVFDDRNRPEANLVLGEVVNLPGRWSSWPPHHHPQPEIYHYRFDRPQGYGHGELGREVHRVADGDTLLIVDGADHAQVAAPGYAMWYLWAIRHLPERRYTVPEFTAEHRWTMERDAVAWRPRRGGA